MCFSRAVPGKGLSVYYVHSINLNAYFVMDFIPCAFEILNNSFLKNCVDVLRQLRTQGSWGKAELKAVRLECLVHWTAITRLGCSQGCSQPVERLFSGNQGKKTHVST